MYSFLIFRFQPSTYCLCSSLSTLLYGNNGYREELRALSLTEPVRHPSYYSKHPCFLIIIDMFINITKKT